MGNSGSSSSIVDKQWYLNFNLKAAKRLFQLQRSIAYSVLTEVVLTAFLAYERSWPLTTVQFYVKKKLKKLGDQILELQELMDRYPHFRILPNQNYKTGLSDSWTRLLRHPSPSWIQEIRRQSCTMGSEIKDWLGLKRSATNEASSHKSSINCRWQTNKLVGEEVTYETYDSNCDVNGHSKD